MTEMDLLNEVRLNVQRLGCTSFRCNVGKIRMQDGRFFDTGLPKGFSDLLIIGKDGQAAFIETKVAPNKPTKEQCKFLLAMILEYGCKAGVAYSVEDSTRIVMWTEEFKGEMLDRLRGWLNGYNKTNKKS